MAHEQEPNLTITALGNRGSGKTTFLLGMYAEMSAGRRGYFLSATDPDVDLRLADRWDKLFEDGELPPPNQPDNISYGFRFMDGLTPLLAIDWLDYRGGALEDERGSESGDVQELHDRLLRSDSIYLVIDGGYLVEPVSESSRRDIMRQTGLRRMSALLQHSLHERAKLQEPPPAPSIVILVTKADLIPPERRTPMDGLARELQELASVCFQGGLSTLVCPVSLGHFGLNPAATVRTEDIDPLDLHLPIIYSLAEYMYQLSLAALEASENATHASTAVQEQLAAVRSGAGAFFRRSQINQLQREIQSVEDQNVAFTSIHTRAAQRAESLFSELERLPRYRDGLEEML
jgi:hypothetical protein